MHRPATLTIAREIAALLLIASLLFGAAYC